ncbi:hypothetical protein KBB27_00230 [Patescibacteria group bacterium]|nr:hypothetical protein [Patescibacteria group bacterium]
MNEWSKAVSENGYEKSCSTIRDEGVYLPTGEKEYREPRYLYHTVLHAPSSSASVDFFGQKSKATLERARIYRITSEIQEIVSSDKAREWMRLLEASGYYEDANPLSDESREEIAHKIRIFFHMSGFYELERFIAEDDFHLFDIESQVSALMNKEIDPIPFEKLAQIENLRSTSYYLARTIEVGKPVLVLDYKKLIQNGFQIYEANLEAVPGPLSGIKSITNYIRTMRSVQSPSDCLVFRKRVETPYESSGGVEISYDPYCPEYLVQPPSVERLQECMRRYSNDGQEHIRFFDPERDYKTIVNILFNDALVARE